MIPRGGRRVEFGLGTIGIGKPWGFANPEVPDERQALTLLERAFALGVRYFDTAPSYGVSEERLGRFLAALTPGERSQVRIATKFGEHWDAVKAEPFVDHSFDALRRSLDGSIARLGRIDFLQLHKTTPQVLGSSDLARAWEYAATLGITAIGASVSDLESAEIAIAGAAYGILQFPYNVAPTDVCGRPGSGRGARHEDRRQPPVRHGTHAVRKSRTHESRRLRLHPGKTLRGRHPERHEVARAPGRKLARLRGSARPPRRPLEKNIWAADERR